MPYTDLRKGRYSSSGQIYFVTTVTQQRNPWFSNFATARAVISEMRRPHESGAIDSLAWVLMPDHLHWLFALQEQLPLAVVLERFKGRSARVVNQRLGRCGAVWQAAYHDHALRSEEDLQQLARYIIANPLRAGLVTRIGEYPHWDAVWL